MLSTMLCGVQARDSLKVQLDQAASRQASLARRAKLADEETARAKRCASPHLTKHTKA